MLALGMLVGSAHLLVQIVLDVIPQGHFLVGLGARIGHRSALLVAEGVVRRPLGEGCRAKLVTVVAEGGIGDEPILIGVEEVFVLLALEHLGAFLLIEQRQVLKFGFVDALIVDLGQRVQLLAQLLELGLALLVSEFGQLPQVDVLRVQGIDADAVVGITVAPGMGDGGVVDGQHLQGALTCAGHPVDHQLEVTEVAHAETALAAQREDGHYRTCQLHGIEWEVGLLQLVDDVFAIFEQRQHHVAVVARFPHGGTILAAHDHELEFDKGLLELAAVDRDDPLVVVVLGHLQGTALVPVPQDGLVTDQTQGIARAQLRGAHLELHNRRVLALG